MGFFRDVTERKQAEAKNKEMSEQLQQAQKMEAIGRLAGGIAHDFNNQLMCIMGYAEILSEQLDDNMLKNDAEFIIEATKRAARLTSNLLAFSRKGKYLSEPTNVHKVIEDVFTILERTIDKKISLKKVLNANPDTINGDPTQIQNSLLNLAINARDALPSGGEIIFKTEIVNIEDIKDIFKNNDECDKMKKGDYLKISVADNGIGINDDTIKHIFEPFFTTKPIGKGTGMGLASVYGTTKSHNGLIKVDSKPGKGATFSLFFPLIDNESTFKKLAGTVDVTRTLKKEANILVVDDEEIIRILLSRTLSSLGYKVVTCKDGLEALEYYRHSWKDIDVVILDIIMPKMNGNEAFFKMQAINKEIKAIVISGFSIDGEAQDLLDAGVKGFIQKPFETNILSKMLTEILNKK
jgi:nitrogen-specific signal transduction histidine kinase/CheY-like chemotaxis protein